MAVCPSGFCEVTIGKHEAVMACPKTAHDFSGGDVFLPFVETAYARLTQGFHLNVASQFGRWIYAGVMESSSFAGKLAMYQAVTAVCHAKPSVWQRSPAFAEAFEDFCECVESLLQLQPAARIFNTVARGIAVEMEVADTILTTEMDELIELFEPVDVAFVDDYTAARSMEIVDAGEQVCIAR